MTTSSPTGPTAVADSPIVLIATLVAARRSGDRPLERIARRRLDALGVRIMFGGDLPAPATSRGKEDSRG